MKSLRPLPCIAFFAGVALLSGPVAAQRSNSESSRPEEKPARPESVSPATPPPPPRSVTRSTAPVPPAAIERLTESTRFKALDTDRDGRISRAEFTLAPNQPIQSATAPGHDAVPGDGQAPARRTDVQNAAGVTDSNIGRRSNLDEVFVELDTDNDGFLSPAELAADRKPEN